MAPPSSLNEASRRGRKPERRQAAEEWLTTYLATAAKPVRAGDVIEDAKRKGISAKTTRRAADELGVVRDPPGGGRTCTWRLPKDPQSRRRDGDDRPSDGGRSDQRHSKARQAARERVLAAEQSYRAGLNALREERREAVSSALETHSLREVAALLGISRGGVQRIVNTTGQAKRGGTASNGPPPTHGGNP